MNWWEKIWKILTFMGIQYAMGRRGSYPFGLLINLNLFQISLLTVFCDVLQTAVLLAFSSKIQQKDNFLNRFLERARRKREALPVDSWRIRLYQKRYLALIFISALPFGGGSVGGSLFALVSGSPPFKSFFFIVGGCTIASVIFFALFSGMFALVG